MYKYIQKYINEKGSISVDLQMSSKYNKQHCHDWLSLLKKMKLNVNPTPLTKTSYSHIRD